MTVTSRRVSLLLLAALLAASCGDDGGDGGGGGGGDTDASACPVDALESAEGPVEITFWHAMGGAEIEATMIEVVDAYNASQDRVNTHSSPAASAGMSSTVTGATGSDSVATTAGSSSSTAGTGKS